MQKVRGRRTVCTPPRAPMPHPREERPMHALPG